MFSPRLSAISMLLTASILLPATIHTVTALPSLLAAGQNSADEKEQELTRLYEAGQKLYAAHDLVGAEKPWREGLRQAEANGSTSRQWDFLTKLGDLLEDRGETEASLSLHQRAHDIAVAVKDDRRLADSLHNLGLNYEELARFPEALDHLRRALVLREGLRNLRDVATTNFGLGNVYADMGRNDLALDYYFKALEMRKQLGDALGGAGVRAQYRHDL